MGILKGFAPWLSVELRATIDEDGNRISGWRTEIGDVRAFLRR
jgi:hypothetical protein